VYLVSVKDLLSLVYYVSCVGVRRVGSVLYPFVWRSLPSRANLLEDTGSSSRVDLFGADKRTILELGGKEFLLNVNLLYIYLDDLEMTGITY